MPLASILHLCCLRRCSASAGSLHLRETGVSWLAHSNRRACMLRSSPSSEHISLLLQL